MQSYVSGPGLDPDSMGSLDPYPDPDSGRQKSPLNIEKKNNKFHFQVLDVLFCGLKASPAAWTFL
jgi:hypothetical protein